MERSLPEAPMISNNKEELKKHLKKYGIVAVAEKTLEAFDLADKAAETQLSVLICGETGTGKEKIAEFIHRRSNRNSGPFVPVNCSAITSTLFESYYFGAEKGAYTGSLKTRQGYFEQADGGTLFLDEIGEMPLEQQPKILRTLETGEIQHVGGEKSISVDVRVIAATNKPIYDKTYRKQSGFRDDLYYRLNHIIIHIAPLQDRKKDIGELSAHLLNHYYASKNENKSITLLQSVIRILEEHSWPGNARELFNVLVKASFLAENKKIKPKHVKQVLAEISERNSQGAESRLISLDEAIHNHISFVLEHTQGNISRAAKILKIDRGTVSSKIKNVPKKK